MALAAIDCGSNSTRLLVTNDAGVALHRDMRITRLSAGVDAQGRLAPDAIERSYTVLREYRVMMDAHGVTNGLVVATSAVRDAANGAAFLAGAEEILGVRGRILLGIEEAHLTFAGATAGLDPDPRPTVVVDIGGGSTELVGPGPGGLVSHSMQLGCVRVTERALGSSAVTPERLAAADTMIDAEIERAFEEVPALADFRGRSRLVGVAGTVATLAHLDMGLADYHREAMVTLMAASHYPLQAHLYLVALHRYLRWRLPGYTPEHHLGGYAYVFLRGVPGPITSDPADGVAGVLVERPPLQRLLALDQLLREGQP